MFEQTFKTQLSFITSDKELIEDLWLEIKTAYSNPNRYYHNLAHLDNLESELLPIKDKISDWQTLILSIAYQDIVYNIQKGDNEEKSARLTVSVIFLTGSFTFAAKKLKGIKMQYASSL